MQIQYNPTTILEFTDQEIESFWNRADRSGGPDSCWVWQGSLMKNGYGRVIRPGNKHYYAHRIACILAHGPIKDLHTLHSCPGGDNRACINPRHLRAGTEQDNTNDKMARGGHYTGIRPCGEKNNKAKLTADSVREIRRMRDEGWTLQAIADRFRVKIGNIHFIVHRKTWKHID